MTLTLFSTSLQVPVSVWFLNLSNEASKPVKENRSLYAFWKHRIYDKGQRPSDAMFKRLLSFWRHV